MSISDPELFEDEFFEAMEKTIPQIDKEQYMRESGESL